MTTIKVPTTLRDEITAGARAESKTVATFLDGLLRQRERDQRFATLRTAIAANPPDAQYWDEFAAWDRIGGEPVEPGRP